MLPACASKEIGMDSVTTVWQSRSINLVTSILFAATWALFASAHLSSFRHHHDAALLLFAAAETLVAALFLVRSAPASVSPHPLDWLLGIAGTFLTLLLRPSSEALLPSASMAIGAGALLQIAAFASLNRSIAVVPARRTIKTRGLYRLVRHPVYASYFLSHTGYALSNSSARNIALVVATLILLLFRIIREERHLAQDPAYRGYMARVRYRLCPYLF
jgi:protein-S-isoprenylcysteine O-methyltransferase Ste14